MSIGRSVSLSKKSRKNKKNGGKNQIDKCLKLQMDAYTSTLGVLTH